MGIRYNRVFLPIFSIFLITCILLYYSPTKYCIETSESSVGDSEGINDPIQDKLPLETPQDGVWMVQEILEIPKPVYTDHNNFLGDSEPRKQYFSRKNRLRYESSEVWRSDGSYIDPEAGLSGLPRLKVPPRSFYPNDGQYLRQNLLGDFNYGADKVFYMLKTGADTQWERMPMHFMTDLTHVQNFALYSDSPGSIFGHEIIDIVSKVPQDIIAQRAELKQYRARLRAHNENWMWDPENVAGYGGWMADRFKNIPMLWDAYTKNPDCEWYIWVDDDSFVFYDNLIKWLETMDHNEMIYTGAASEIVHNGDYFNFAHGGSVVVVSHAVAEALFGPEGRRMNNLTNEELVEKWLRIGVDICCGDAMLAYMILKELDLRMYVHPDLGDLLWFGAPFQGDSLSTVIIPPKQLCIPAVTWHHLLSHDMELLYTYERLWDKDRPILYDDIYQDFFLPYIVEERPNWWVSESGKPLKYPGDNQPADTPVEFEGQTYRPGVSKSDCKELCVLTEECTAWSWRYEHCVLQTSGISLGSAANAWNDRGDAVSGWMVDRIRRWRANSTCDTLKETNGVYNDDISTSEGWMLRRLAEENEDRILKQESTIPDNF